MSKTAKYLRKYDTFGSRLKVICMKNGITQDELGKAVHNSPDTIGNWYRDRTFPSDPAHDLPNLMRFLRDEKHIDVSLDHLLCIEEAKTHDAEFVKTYTGLSDDAVDYIHSCGDDNEERELFLNALNFLFKDNSTITGILSSASDIQFLNTKIKNYFHIFKVRFSEYLELNDEVNKKGSDAEKDRKEVLELEYELRGYLQQVNIAVSRIDRHRKEIIKYVDNLIDSGIDAKKMNKIMKELEACKFR